MVWPERGGGTLPVCLICCQAIGAGQIRVQLPFKRVQKIKDKPHDTQISFESIQVTLLLKQNNNQPNSDYHQQILPLCPNIFIVNLITYNNMEVEQTLQIPSFTLYPVTTEDLKTCYESASYKILCSLTGPYFDRKMSQLQPYFNIQITQAQFNHSSVLKEQELIRLQKKVQQVIACMVISGKYQRMVFDISFQIIQFNPHNPSVFLLPPLLNLLSYTSMLKCLEIMSAFSCSSAILRNQKLIWQYTKDMAEQKNDNRLVLCSNQRDQSNLITHFVGQYSFSNYQKLGSALQEANDQLNRFQLQKVGEVYQMFHQ